ncbi:NRDE family protein [Alloalcanivorax xenomutans]|jgi:uncharacterized protein with NRDE domain|uniref:NRDE family protein n=1 Tax=Alloalcanivorax xenomutans TaxID=1094342 RepID=A0A9Q3W4A1_9GAMM|nr:NRDE family protein [Alloalcanivorax xenomutans]ERS10588.1 hypothetical protein Q668_03130 [Alcanivorax sp. PN-3]KYZ84647.1 hypothetical protein A3Q32_08510 [Alcanivorax sp. KX64203]PHS67080.1 MAG: hypothetical protein COB00_09650 [Alcanivorax sp.]ARB44366.1 hypothetical protein P40_02150 [Alloalcanivorax xenomutans]MCE7508734.1 NRDE family protein [Alloalcanivorax xenomutans]
MCIVLFRWQPGDAYPLAVSANRDEFHQRPAEPARWRGDVFCGLDLRAGGTWLGIHRDGRFAVVTNYREPVAERTVGELSRGLLPQAFLESHQSPELFCLSLEAEEHRYSGFNLLVGDRESLWYLSNRGPAAQPVKPGLHGLSNGILDDPWPKVERGKQRLARVLDGAASNPPSLRDLLGVVVDPYQPPEEDLPDTGVERELERLVAPIFIQSQQYGTRASSAVLLPREGAPMMREQCWRADGEADGAPTDS